MHHLARLLLALSALALTIPAHAAPQQPAHQLVARIPRTPAVWRTLNAQNVDVFTASARTVDIRTTHAQLDALVKEQGIAASSVKIVVGDLDKVVAQERARLAHHVQEGVDGEQPDYHAEYHTYEDMKKFASRLASDHPDLATFVPSIGKSVEGRDLFQVKITAPGDASKRKRVWLQAMQHAREWISGATAQYIADTLIASYNAGDKHVVQLLNALEFVITPVANPDGYAYTWTNERLWRKNRAKQPVDLNRNWPSHWDADNQGSSKNPASDTYRGSSAASEPEVQALIKAFKATPNIIGSIDFHSFSEAILRPYGWTDDLTPDEEQLLSLSKQMVSAIRTVQGTTYTPMTKLYPVAGASRDWLYEEGKSYAFTIELSPNDDDEEYGFVLPPKEIRRVGKELWNAVVVFAETLLTLPAPKIAAPKQ